MVNIRIVSRYSEQLPSDPSSSLKIQGGPLYPANEILELLNNNNQSSIIPWTVKCTKDIQKWALDADDLLDLIGIQLFVAAVT